MEIRGITPMNIGDMINIMDNPFQPIEQMGVLGGAAPTTATNTFDTFMRAMMDNINETNEAVRASQEFQLALAQGYTDDILGLQLAIARADSALNFTVQVTNRLLEAYREIIRMQI